ncbi:MAG TPA: hypothetical protein VLT88_10515, partial [Desulfosarcina sp.]|nr:hypothetical protein [Desulfosarcina sp.]
SGDGPYWVAIRPENVAVSCRPVGHGASNRLQGRLQGILNRDLRRCPGGGLLLHAIGSRRELLRVNLAEGDPVFLAIAPEDIHLIRRKNGER